MYNTKIYKSSSGLTACTNEGATTNHTRLSIFVHHVPETNKDLEAIKKHLFEASETIHGFIAHKFILII